MKRQIRLTDADLKKIEATVAEAEKKTSGEIVPMIVRASHDYWWVHWFYAALGWLVVSLWAGYESWSTPWSVPVSGLLLYQFGFAVIGFMLPSIEFFKRLVIPKKWSAGQVHRQCLANFMAEGLHETRDRTGVLIFLSQLEHRVEILADRGINSKTPDGYWNEQIDILIRGVHEGKIAEALVEVIGHVGEKLAADFPPRDDDTNELSNHLRMGHPQNENKED